jgi:hypothetical protein
MRSLPGDVYCDFFVLRMLNKFKIPLLIILDKAVACLMGVKTVIMRDEFPEHTQDRNDLQFHILSAVVIKAKGSPLRHLLGIIHGLECGHRETTQSLQKTLKAYIQMLTKNKRSWSRHVIRERVSIANL